MATQFSEKISSAISSEGKTRAFLSDDIDEVVFNVILSDNDSDSLKVTRHAIEDGSDVTDHVISTPKKFSFEAIFTDADQDLLNPSSFINKSIQERLDIISKWIEEKTVLTYFGHDIDFESVVIENIGRKKSSSTGEGLALSMTIAKINIAQSQKQEITVKNAPTKKGKTAKQADEKKSDVSADAVKNKSWLKTLAG